jgi:hypothetical protein
MVQGKLEPMGAPEGILVEGLVVRPGLALVQLESVGWVPMVEFLGHHPVLMVRDPIVEMRVV